MKRVIVAEKKDSITGQWQWRCTLECGHQVRAKIQYEYQRGVGKKAKPAPKRLKCRQCETNPEE